MEGSWPKSGAISERLEFSGLSKTIRNRGAMPGGGVQASLAAGVSLSGL